MTARDHAYTMEIEPLVERILELCRAHDVTSFMSFQGDDVQGSRHLRCRGNVLGVDIKRVYFRRESDKPIDILLPMTRTHGAADAKTMMNGSAALKLVLDTGLRVTRQVWVDEDKVAEGNPVRWIGALQAAAFGVEAPMSLTCSIGASESPWLPSLYEAWSCATMPGSQVPRRGSVRLDYKPGLQDILATDWFVIEGTL